MEPLMMFLIPLSLLLCLGLAAAIAKCVVRLYGVTEPWGVGRTVVMMMREREGG